MSHFYTVPYRWLPRTIFPNLWWIVTDLWYGIKNVIRWAPVIWLDRDWDWSYLAEIMEYKLHRMSENFKRYGNHIGSQKDARRMMVCAELLKRLRTESYQCPDNGMPVTSYNAKRDSMVGRHYQEYIGKILGKHLRSWWD